MPNGEAPAKPDLSPIVESEFSVAETGMPDPSEGMTEAAYKAIIKKHYPGATNIQNVDKALRDVYSTYGYEGAVRFMERWAEHAVKEHPDLDVNYNETDWNDTFSKVDCGFSSELLTKIHMTWIGSSKEIRAMESKELTASSSGSDIRRKTHNDALNALVQKTGVTQPSMLYRGLNGELPELRSAQPGEKVTFGGISSFTAWETTANSFAGHSGIVLRLPKKLKQKPFVMNGLNEAEWIIPGDDYVVASRDRKGNRLYLALACGSSKRAAAKPKRAPQ